MGLQRALGWWPAGWAGLSLRSRLMVGILLPVLLFLSVSTLVLYRQALGAANTAYDRTLLASAKAIGEQLQVVGAEGGPARLQASLLYSSLEAFEADNRSRMVYRVTGFDGEMVSGFADLAAWQGRIPAQSVYAALVDFYDDTYQGVPVRVAVLLQPVAGDQGQGMATVQVAETLELRQTLARQILVDTLWRQLALLALIALVVVVVVQRATRPVRHLGALLAARSESDLTALPTDGAPLELLPLVDATNQHMARLDHLLAHQKRFVRDASHQLRTPLAVLKAQVQSAQRGDVPPAQALQEIGHTVDGATELANQMLALAKAEQMQAQGGLSEAPVTDWAAVVRQVALDTSPLLVEKGLDFELHLPAAPVGVRGHEWALRELARNLLHNALRHSPPGGGLQVRLQVLEQTAPGWAALVVADEGPGIAPELRPHLFQPFARGGAGPGHGAGLGLAICHGIVLALGGGLSLDNRQQGSRVAGLDAVVRLPLA
jgi:two-component system sensor histidine kinase TctE